MKKGGFLRNVLDTIRSNQANQNQPTGPGGGGPIFKSDHFGGQLKSHHFSLNQVAVHGFPHQPSALAYDPVQKIAAIGTKTGQLRVFGKPGVDLCAQHKPECPVTHIKFIVNQGALITVTSDNSIHLWSLRGPNLNLQLSSATGPSSQGLSPAQSSHSPIQGLSPSGLTSTSSSSTHNQHQQPSSSPTPAYSTSDTSYAMDQLVAGQSPSSIDSARPQLPLRQPQIVHTLKFQREHITFIHQTLQSKWLYIGTERGNVHVANVETFQLSPYSIAWNKAIELSRKTHPGSIIHLSECPQDTNKLLIGYESGCIVLWDLKGRTAEGRYYQTENLLWLCWHYEGKQFVAAHGDGSLVTWQTRSNARPTSISHPHAKTTTSSPMLASGLFDQQQQQQQQQQQHLMNPPDATNSSSFARSLNYEWYRPINKVEWKTSKSNEQFLLFSGGLQYDAIIPETASSTAELARGRSAGAVSSNSSRVSPGGLSSSTATSALAQGSLSQSQGQYLKASSAPPMGPNQPPIGALVSPSISPGASVAARQSQQGGQQSSTCAVGQQGNPKERKSLRSTSLTVMAGKSITVLEMDDTIIDFITITDLAPFENDASDPFAVMVLLNNDLILIDLTSSGYPSFESPYSWSQLNESPVSCIEYLADCRSDLIPYLYSSSKSVVSRGPKKGFSDKDWPINGGEWGQSLQSYPELVLTGHLDGTIKLWDMSGVNFDLISKIKTAKLFERPNKPANMIILPNKYNGRHNQSNSTSIGNNNNNAINAPSKRAQASTPSPDQTTNETECIPAAKNQDDHSIDQQLVDPRGASNDEDYFAIEKMKYCPATRHLLVAGAFAQVIQLKLTKRDPSNQPAPAGHEMATILVDPNESSTSGAESPVQIDATIASAKRPAIQRHLLLKARGGGGSSSSSSSASLASNRNRLGGFQAELVCLTPMLVTEENNKLYYCQAPPKVTTLALQSNHSILAYAHEQGLVLIDTIQKCVIMSATLSDLYGASVMTNNRDISIQPFATSSILQHHYQSGLSAWSSNNNLGLVAADSDAGNLSSLSGNNDDTFLQQQHLSHNINPDNGTTNTKHRTNEETRDNGASQHDNNNGGSSIQKFGADSGSEQQACGQRPLSSSHHRSDQLANAHANSSPMFQRQLSTNALYSHTPTSGASSPAAATVGGRPFGGHSRLFQRQMTASQLLSSSSSACASSPTAANSGAGGSRVSGAPPQHKNKRIISRMLSISNITLGGGGGATAPSATAPPPASSEWAQDGAGSEPSPTKAMAAPASFGPAQGGADPCSSASGSFSPTLVGAGMGSARPDKINSSFHRSRSSSGSSCVHHNAPTSTHSSAALPERILCLRFVDWLGGVERLATGGAASQSLSAGSTSASAATGASSLAAGGAANKSLTPMDQGHAHSGSPQLALWLGSSHGCVMLVALSMPDNEDNRVLQLQSVSAEPIPSACAKLAGAILALETFAMEPVLGAQTSSGSGATHHNQHQLQHLHLASQSSSLEADSATGGAGMSPSEQTNSPASAGNPHLSSSSSAAACGGGGSGGATTAGGHPSVSSSSHSSSSFEARTIVAQLLAVVSEKQARVYLVPSGARGETQMSKLLVTERSANLLADTNLSSSSYAARAAVVHMRQPEEPCLVSYLATGSLQVHSLPRLKPLHESDFAALSSPRVASSMCFSRNAHCLYQPSPSELSKFTLSAQYGSIVNEMTGCAWLARDMPDMPRTNFFRSLFTNVAGKQSDRDELFAGAGSASSQSVAKHISADPQSSSSQATTSAGQATGVNLEKLRAQAGGASEIRMTRDAFLERGEKLGELEDKTLAMMNQADSYSQAAHQLAQRYKEKKWYQF